MAVVISPYNHTALRNRTGANASGDDYLVTLYSALPFLPAATTKTAAEVGATQIATANGYTQDAKLLTGVVLSTVATKNVMFDADDVIWTPTTGNIAAAFALISNGTDTDDPPMYHVDFGGTVTAVPGDDFEILWHPDGIERVVVTP
jgi:hypothetical protein